MSALVAESVRVTLDGTTILHDISLRAEAGSWLGIIGPNGAGKSTFLHAVCGVVPFAGSITVGGDAIGSLDRRTRAQRIALVPQAPVVPMGMRVIDYVLLGRTPHRGSLAPETVTDLEIARDVLAHLDLTSFARRALTSLSGGERQRAFLARALAQKSSVVLLDEPTAALDVGHQVDVLHLVDALRVDLGLTIVSTLHDLTLAGRYPDTLAMLAGGRVVAIGPPADVLQPERIAEHYGAEVRILHDDDGGIVVVPTRKRATT